MNRPVPTRRAKPSEEGYILVAVMFMLALLIIAMAVAVPKVTAAIQRDREVETYHRGLQYRRAIQLYYRKFHTYPPSIDALVKTNNVRFLRKRYIDPITGKDDWKPVFFGQNKAPLAMGFFGQPLGGIGMGGNGLAGIGPQGGNGIAGAGGVGGAGAIGGAGGIGAGGIGAGGIGAGGGIGQAANPIDPGQNNGAANPNDPNAAGGNSQPLGGQTFGGAGIVGFTPNSPKPSILIYKKKDHYNEWEFTYSYLSDMNSGMGMMPQQPLQPGCAAGVCDLGGGGAGQQQPQPGPQPNPVPGPQPNPAPQQ